MRRHGWLNIVVLALGTLALLITADVIFGGENGVLGNRILRKRFREIKKQENKIARAQKDISRLKEYEGLRDAFRREFDKAQKRLLVARNDDDARLEFRKELDRIAEAAKISLTYQHTQPSRDGGNTPYPSVEAVINVDQQPFDKILDFIYRVENAAIMIATAESQINVYNAAGKGVINYRCKFQACYNPPPTVEKGSPEKKSTASDKKTTSPASK